MFYNKQFIDSNDKKALTKVLNQKLITGGKSVRQFEKKIKNYLNCKHVISCSSGTAGLHLAFEALGLKKDDIVIMPAINFVASFSMASLYKCKIYFTDVDKFTGQMTPETLLKTIKKNNLKKIKAVVFMHMGGYPEKIQLFYKLKKKYKFKLIEDACHAFGSSYAEKNKQLKIGSCKHSDISVFSFHAVKTITTGEGGAVTTNNKTFAKIMYNFKSHNILRKSKYWDYDIKRTAYNYRLSDINCSLGISQLKKINFFLSERKKIFKIYASNLSKFHPYLRINNYEKKNMPSYHLFLISINFKKIKSTKNDFFNFVNKKNIFPQFHYKPIFEFSFYKYKKNNLKNFTGAKYYYQNTISIPIFVGLKMKQIKKIINTIKKFMIIHHKLPLSRINNF